MIPSSAPNGSSSSIAGLPSRTVRRNAARWRMPPDSCHGHASLEAAEPEALEQRRARVRARGRATHAGELEPDRDVVDRPPPGQQRVALRHERAGAEATPARPSIRTSPASSRSSPARIWNSVLLPAPLGPISATNSPGCGDEVDAVERRAAAARRRRA